LQLAACDEQPIPDSQLLGHRALSQLPAPSQVTSHAHESRQSTSVHEPEPEHVIAHSAEPHFTESHELLPLHATTHDAAPSQSTSRHPLLPQVIVQ
jgi:hypothetical protein